MITHTLLSIEINNRTMPKCIGLHLSQPIHGHHFFRVEYSGRSIETDPISLASDSVKLVGTSIKIGFNNSKNEERVFWGVITAVHATGNNQAGYTQNIIFEGYSPTILLENGPSCQSFSNKSLSEIVSTATAVAPSNLLTLINKPRYTEKLAYSVQYNESNFAFVNRMARRFGEWCYYDGLELVFGDKSQPTLDLLYGYNLHHFDFSMKTNSVQRKFSAYNYKGNEILEGATKSSDSSLNGMVAHAMQTSQKTWQPAEAVYLHQFDDELSLKSQLDNVAKLNIQASAANRITFTGTSSHPGLFPGAVINVKSLGTDDLREFGQYVITNINHQYRDGGNYQNQFEAVPFDVEVSPQTGTAAFPASSPQSGNVTDNNDPEGLGRVKVQLSWQRDTTTPWLRISTPYAGSDKGMFFVPEVGEEVVVGFENGNAEKPYVMGSLYHGKAKPESWKSDRNDVKAIRTRSGHTIEFNDKEGEEEVHIYDKDKVNVIILSSQNKEMKLISTGDLFLQGKNVTITAEEGVSIEAQGKELGLKAAKSVAIESSGDNITIKASKKLIQEGQEIDVNAQTKLQLEGGTQASLKSMKSALQGNTSKVEVI